MKLYSFWRSTTSFRVRAALNIKGIACEIVPVDLLQDAQSTPDYTAVNPGQCVPTLVLSDGTALTQSLAIIEYLDAVRPAPRLIPADPLTRAKVQAAAQCFACDVHPVNNLRVVRYLQSEHGLPDEDIRRWMRHWMAKGCDTLEALIDPQARFCFGDSPDIADICLVSQLYNAKRWGLDLAPWPGLARVDAECLAHPAIAAAHPDQQPEAKVA